MYIMFLIIYNDSKESWNFLSCSIIAYYQIIT